MLKGNSLNFELLFLLYIQLDFKITSRYLLETQMRMQSLDELSRHEEFLLTKRSIENHSWTTFLFIYLCSQFVENRENDKVEDRRK